MVRLAEEFMITDGAFCKKADTTIDRVEVEDFVMQLSDEEVILLDALLSNLG